MTPLDPTALRLRFPALARNGEDGWPVVYADAPGGSQVPETVMDATPDIYGSGISNTHGAFAASEETDALIADARRAAADIRGLSRARSSSGRLDDVAPAPFTFVRAHAPTGRRGRRDVARPRRERPSVVLAAQDAGATVRWVDIRDDDVTLDLDSFDAALNEDATGRVHARVERRGTSPRRPSSSAASSTRWSARRRRRRAPRAAPCARHASSTPTSSRAPRTSSSSRTWAC